MTWVSIRRRRIEFNYPMKLTARGRPVADARLRTRAAAYGGRWADKKE